MVASALRPNPRPEDLLPALPALPALLDAVSGQTCLNRQLDAVTTFVERLAPSLRCSILLADTARGTLHNGSSPSLPAGYTAAIEGFAYGEGRGSCGTAAARLEMVIVADIQASPLWLDFLDTARTYGLAACWSMPIVDAEQGLLGTFAMYYSEPREPTAAELGVLRVAAPITALVILRHRDGARLRASEDRYRQLAEQSPDGLLVHRDGGIVYANRGAAELLGAASADLLVGRSLRAFEPAGDEDRLSRHRTGMHSGWLRREDGVLRAIEATASSCELGGADGTLLIIRDVTARRAVESALSAASSHEQELIGSDLQEGLCQDLTGISMMVSALAHRLGGNDPSAAGELGVINGLLARTIATAKRLATDMAPVGTERAGLGGALVALGESLGKRHGLRIGVRVTPGADADLGLAEATQLYRIAKEALTNVVRHSHARRATVSFDAEPARYSLVIADDGVGLGPDPHRMGLGINGMRYRAERVGGSVSLEPRRPSGTRVRVLVPRAR
jgi:PAS domain S-box-containing protein